MSRHPAGDGQEARERNGVGRGLGGGKERDKMEGPKMMRGKEKSVTFESINLVLTQITI